MAFVPPRDRVAENSTSNSQSIFTVTGAIDTSHKAFSAFMSVGDTTIGGVVEAGVAYKTGVLTYSATNEVTVTSVKDSNGTFSSGGTKEVFMGLPALVALMFDGIQALTSAQQLQGASNLGVSSSAGSQSLTATQKNQIQKNEGLPAILRSCLVGLTLSTSGPSTTFSMAAGVAADSTNADVMTLGSAISKTTSSWAVGSAAGALDTGTIANNTWYYPYLIKRIDTQVVDVLASLSPGTSSAVTISNASPGQVTWTSHGLQANAPLTFATTGSLPTGLTAGTQYFVKTVVDLNTFTVSATQGGTAINTSSAGSGVHTANASPVLPANYTISRRIRALKTNGSAQWVPIVQIGDQTLWSTSPALDFNSTSPTSPTNKVVSVPPGINVEVILNYLIFASAAACDVYIYSPLIADQTPSASASPLETGSIIATGATQASLTAQARVITDTNAQVRVISINASQTLRLATVGWIERSGKDA